MVDSPRGTLLYLSRADLEAASPGPVALADAVEAAIRAVARGEALNAPKSTLHPPRGRLFQAMVAWGGEPPLATVKCVGLAPDNHLRGLPHIGGLIVVLDGDHGMPVAVMDGTWVTAARTASLSLVAARRLARADSRSVGFVGCGVQARSHLEALRSTFPISRVVAYARRPESVESFLSVARAFGLEARAAAEPRAAVEGLDLVVTSVPAAEGLEPFLDPAWLAPGSFGTFVDLGRAWKRAGYRDLDRLVVDDLEQERHAEPRLADPEMVSGDLGGLVAGRVPGRRDAGERTAFGFRGLSLADLAAAACLYRAAGELGLGVRLPL